MESMEIKLAKLYNTLCLISTKGDETKLMADCLKFIEQTIAELKAEANKPKGDVPKVVKPPEDVPKDVKPPEENKEV